MISELVLADAPEESMEHIFNFLPFSDLVMEFLSLILKGFLDCWERKNKQTNFDHSLMLSSSYLPSVFQTL